MSTRTKLTTAAADVPPRDTKIGMIIALLSREEGAALPELAGATGWGPHSLRGAIAGTVKKKRGLLVTTHQIDGRTIYRIMAQ